MNHLSDSASAMTYHKMCFKTNFRTVKFQGCFFSHHPNRVSTESMKHSGWIPMKSGESATCVWQSHQHCIKHPSTQVSPLGKIRYMNYLLTFLTNWHQGLFALRNGNKPPELFSLRPKKTNIAPGKMMVGILFSSWNGPWFMSWVPTKR